MVEVTLIEASRRAALQEMRRDERVWVLGEDVARGGLWGQYKDFLSEFGEQRVVSTPISESTIMGAGLGSALVGMRPIIEMRMPKTLFLGWFGGSGLPLAAAFRQG